MIASGRTPREILPMAGTLRSRHARDLQPVAAVLGRRSVRQRPAAAGRGGGERRGRRGGGAVGLRPALGHGRDVRAGAARQREHAETEDLRHQGLSPRRGRVPSGLSRTSWPRALAPGCMPRPGDARRASARRAPAEVARAARYYMVAQVENGHMCPITMTRACVGALAVEPALRDRLIAEDRLAQLRPALHPVVGEGRHHARHGHDREAGRHRRARQHHGGDARRRRLHASPATNGSCRRRCATRSWCWRRRRAG